MLNLTLLHDFKTAEKIRAFQTSLMYLLQTPNETVEKLILGSTFPGQPLVERPDSPSEGGLTDVSLGHRSAERPKRVDLAEIMYQGEQSPLYIHFQFGPEREAVHALLDTDVSEDRLDDSESSGIDPLSHFTVDLCLHLID